VEEQSPDDFRVAVGGCEVERGGAGQTDYGNGGVAVSIGVAARESL
jgi:hypothetical protein